MNAYELADELDAMFTKADWEAMPDVVAILRQQADQIKHLDRNYLEACKAEEKALLKIAELEHCLIVEQEHNEMLEKENDKPVAWMSPDGKVSPTEGKLFYIPLYTRPSKQLSDEKIASIWASGEYYILDEQGCIDEIKFNSFARAIIKEMNK